MEKSLEDIDIEFLRKYINRAFWRLQYRFRKQNNVEIYNLQETLSSESFDLKVMAKLDLESLIYKIPSEKSRYIIVRTVLEGIPEKDVAIELKISQQAVNKCKKKTLKDLKMKIETSV